MRGLVLGIFLLGLIPSIFLNPYLGVLLFSWMSFMSPHRLVYGFMTAIPLVLIVALVTILAWLLSDEPKRLRFDWTVKLILAFALITSITTMLALYPVVADVQWPLTIKSLLFVLVTVALTTNRVRAHALLWVMAVSIGYFGFKGGIFAIITGGSFKIYGPPETVIGDNNDIGAGLLVALPLMNYLRINSAARWVQLGWLVVMGSSLLAIVSTYSRAALLGLVALSVFFWFKSKRKLISAIIIPIVVLAALAFMPQQYMDRMETITHYQQDNSAMSRIMIWGVAIEVALDHPLTGGGFGVTQSPTIVDHYRPGADWHAVHNIFLGVLAEQGFIGFLIWFALLVVAWRNTRWIQRSTRDRPEWRWANDFARMAEVSLVAYCVVGSFGNYQYWDYYFTLVGLLAATCTMIQRAALPQASALPSQPVVAPAPLAPAHPVTIGSTGSTR